MSDFAMIDFILRTAAIAESLAKKGLPFTLFNVQRENVLMLLEGCGFKEPEGMLSPPERKQQ